MPAIRIILEGDGCWPDLTAKEVIHLGNDAPPIQVAALPGGMAGGRTSVSIRLDLPDGRVVVAETSLYLFVTAGRALHAKYPEVF